MIDFMLSKHTKEFMTKNDQNEVVVIQSSNKSFPPPNLSMSIILDLNLYMMLINLFAVVYSSTHSYVISLNSYIFGMLILANKSPYINIIQNKKRVYPFYILNLIVWYCELSGIRISQPQQVYICGFMITWFYWYEVIGFITSMFKSLLMDQPKFTQVYLTSQMATLKFHISIFFQVVFKWQQLRAIRHIPLLIRMIQCFKLRKFRHYVSAFVQIFDMLGMISKVFTVEWYIFKTIFTLLTFWIDFTELWDFHQVKEGKRLYNLRIYLITAIVNVCQRLYWIRGVDSTNIVFQIYRRLSWNLVRVDLNYIKNGKSQEVLLKKFKSSKSLIIKKSYSVIPQK